MGDGSLIVLGIWHREQSVISLQLVETHSGRALRDWHADQLDNADQSLSPSLSLCIHPILLSFFPLALSLSCSHSSETVFRLCQHQAARKAKSSLLTSLLVSVNQKSMQKFKYFQMRVHDKAKSGCASHKTLVIIVMHL